MKIGIISAMREEISLMIDSLSETLYSFKIGNRTYYQGGKMGEHELYIVFSGWGKVAAATTATTLINKFEIDLLIFTGVAGAIDMNIKIGDVVVGNALIQHDMDATPLFSRFEVPLTSKSKFFPPHDILTRAILAAKNYLQIHSFHKDVLTEFSIRNPKVYEGLIASGDKFISTLKDKTKLKAEIPQLLAVEMEGAAVAQVCEDYNKPYVIIRTISDSADHHAHHDFAKFINSVAKHYSLGIIENLLFSL